MNRSIKFRAYQDDKMLIMPMSGNYACARFFVLLYEDAPIMQFTGLQDRNGKDIYEGDRVKFIAIEDEMKVHKSDSTGIIEWDSEDAGFYVLNDSDKFPHVKFWFAENLEVIGNIYEHPELIK